MITKFVIWPNIIPTYLLTMSQIWLSHKNLN